MEIRIPTIDRGRDDLYFMEEEEEVLDDLDNVGITTGLGK